MKEKGTLQLEEHRIYVVASHVFALFLAVMLFLIGGLIIVGFMEICCGEKKVFISPFVGVFFLIIIFCGLFIFFLRYLCRTQLKIYTEGIIPKYKPLRYVLKNEEYFVPWDKVLHITFFDSEKHTFSGFALHKKPPRWYPQQRWWFYGVEIKKGRLVYIDRLAFKKPTLEKLKSLNLESRPNFVDWETFRKISKGRWMM
jgi:hypothetical protein